MFGQPTWIIHCDDKHFTGNTNVSQGIIGHKVDYPHAELAFTLPKMNR